MHNSIGLTTSASLERLHNDIEQVLEEYKSKYFKKHFLLSWLHYAYEAFDWRNKRTVLSGSSIFLILLSSVSLMIETNASLVLGLIVFMILILNIIATINECRLRRNEIPQRVRTLLTFIKNTIVNTKLNNSNLYPHLYTPYSPCITLQWTYRDGMLVNLPWALLVQGDTILMRPGQVSPGYCQLINSDENDNEYAFLNPKQVYGPSTSTAAAKRNEHCCEKPKTRKPLENKLYRLLETPYVNNLRMALEQALEKPVTCINRIRHLIMVRVLEQIVVVLCLILVLIVCFGRYYFTGQIMFILDPILVVLPLLPIIFPIVWILLNHLGNAFLRSLFDCSVRNEVHAHQHSMFGEEETDTVNIVVDHLMRQCTWKQIWNNFLAICSGSGADTKIMTRSANMLHVLGTVTALCCVDKKGILSWPNPTAEKIFFLRSSNDNNYTGSQTSSKSSLENDDDDLERNESEHNPVTVAEVLDLTHDHKDPFKLHFDDPDWNRFISSLKPLGLAILLNTCNIDTQEYYTQFCSHITCEAMYNENVIPVTNRRCLCELAKQIGFSEQAQAIFKLEQQLSTFRHLQPELVRKDNKFARSLHLSTRLKFPFPHMVATIVRELNSGTYQLLSQGTADIILDACVDYWNGHDVDVLTAADRKRVLDFYQRTSLTAYCTAFAYRPLTVSTLIDGINCKLVPQRYLELPSNTAALRRYFNTTKHQRTRFTLTKKTHSFSTDSVNEENDNDDDDDVVEDDHDDENHCFDVQCNQVFIGMVTMQYQVQTDMVHLIEQLERACIRFVHFSKENELRSRVFSEKMGLESGWNCHISLLSERNNSGGPSECWANNGTARVCSPASLSSLHWKRSPVGLSTENGNLEQLRSVSLSAPSAINLDHATVKFDPDVEANLNTNTNTNETKNNNDNNDVDDSNDDQENTQIQISPMHEHCQSLSCLTDSTEQSAPVHFDMSNRAKLPRGIEKIRPHIEQIDNVPLLVSLFTDCTPTVTREMLHIMQDFGEVICVMCSSANADNMGICLQADASIAVEPMYPQVCQQVPAFKTATVLVELSRELNSLACPLTVRREDPLPVYPLIMFARHYMLTLWSAVQYWLCCCIALAFLQLGAMLLLTPAVPLLTIGQLLWLSMVFIPVLSVSLMAVRIDSNVMQTPLGHANNNSMAISFDALVFVGWCYGMKFMPCIVVACVVFSYTYVENLYSAQQLCFVTLVLHFVTISVSFVHRQHLIWRKSPHHNLMWLILAIVFSGIHIAYAVVSVTVSSYFVLTLVYSSPFVSFVLTEFIKWKEIKVNLRYQRRARLDFGTKLGMNSPF